MAHIVFVQLRSPHNECGVVEALRSVCRDLTPDEIRSCSESVVTRCLKGRNAYFAIQNRPSDHAIDENTLSLGWDFPADEVGSEAAVKASSIGSYVKVHVNEQASQFYCDQLGSRTLWYFLNDEMLVVSTSQRAIVQLKGQFKPRQLAISWFISSGCQGPHLSWDEDVLQVRPEFVYNFDVVTWSVCPSPRGGREIMNSGSRYGPFLQDFERSTKSAIGRIVGKHRKGQGLLPLSGGLDSRLLLALQTKEKAAEPTLVNWGVHPKKYEFSDRVAAREVAAHYNKKLLAPVLPEEVEDFDLVLDRFVYASEGRLDQFNAYADGFKMWENFVRSGFRYVMRGDIPFTEGVDTDEASARAHLGLEMMADFQNAEELGLSELVQSQIPLDVSRARGETLIRWRDRLYAEWRVPMVISAFSDIVAPYVDSLSPMMNWEMYRQYMALPDHQKGNKKHIEELWRLRDNSGVSSHAVSALCPCAEYFQSAEGVSYLLRKVRQSRGSDYVPKLAVHKAEEYLEGLSAASFTRKQRSGFWRSVRGWVVDHFPAKLKGHIKAARPRVLQPMTVAYRLVMVSKILSMYHRQARLNASFKVGAASNSLMVQKT